MINRLIDWHSILLWISQPTHAINSLEGAPLFGSKLFEVGEIFCNCGSHNQSDTWFSRLPFTFPSDKETDHVFNLSEEAQKTIIGDVPDFTNVSDDPPPTFTSGESPKPPTDEELLDDLIFEDKNKSIGAIVILPSFNMLQNPSS
ncbi:unnamed protein product [Lactuca saligna]|uniref:Uncharacterized protein n=1 Tax=Lactuca saligna TaxID=75948 RepID=A0AA35YTT3_LACSI|nr:unnamed protein product [Lactuca saligna]